MLAAGYTKPQPLLEEEALVMASLEPVCLRGCLEVQGPDEVLSGASWEAHQQAGSSMPHAFGDCARKLPENSPHPGLAKKPMYWD